MVAVLNFTASSVLNIILFFLPLLQGESNGGFSISENHLPEVVVPSKTRNPSKHFQESDKKHVHYDFNDEKVRLYFLTFIFINILSNLDCKDLPFEKFICHCFSQKTRFALCFIVWWVTFVAFEILHLGGILSWLTRDLLILLHGICFVWSFNF